MKKIIFTFAVAALVAAPGLSLADHCVSNDQCGSSGAGRICREGNDVWATSKGCPDSATYPGDIGVRDGEPCAQNTEDLANSPVGGTLDDLFEDCD